jgi:hypothetical protein
LDNCPAQENIILIVKTGEMTMEKPTKYKLVNNQDGNNEIELESTNEEDAVTEALEVLGWSLVTYKDE